MNGKRSATFLKKKHPDRQRLGPKSTQRQLSQFCKPIQQRNLKRQHNVSHLHSVTQ